MEKMNNSQYVATGNSDYDTLPFDEKRVQANYVDINGMPLAIYSKWCYISFLNGVTSLTENLLRDDQKIEGAVIKVTALQNEFAFIPYLPTVPPGTAAEPIVIVDGFEKGYLKIDSNGSITCGPNMPINKPFKAAVKVEYAKLPVL